MKTLISLFIAVVLLFHYSWASESREIYIQAHKSKPLIKIVNPHEQAVYCVLINEMGEMEDFYIKAKGESVPISDKVKLWCKEPEPKV